MGLSSRQLLAELTESNDFFDMIVDMIPAKLYIAGQSGDDFNPKPNRYYKGATEGSKEARKAAAKVAKRRKLDPNQAESTTAQKERLEATRQDTPPARMAPAPTAPPTPQESSSPYGSRIEALRAKLQAKIASQQQHPKPSTPNEVVSKRAARRAEKQKRQAEAAQRKKSNTTKVNNNNTNNAQYKVAADPAKDLEQVDYGRLSGLNPTSKANYLLSANKSLANLSKTKNLKKILADAEAKQKKLEELKKGSAEDKAKAVEMQWGDTLKEADGQRIKTDPSKIKKVLKRKAAKKTKSQKAWKSRMEQVSEKKNERQKIRQHNLTARKQGGAVGANLSKKKIVEPDQQQDKGRRLSRAGFEGKKNEYINQKKSSKVQ